MEWAISLRSHERGRELNGASRPRSIFWPWSARSRRARGRFARSAGAAARTSLAGGFRRGPAIKRRTRGRRFLPGVAALVASARRSRGLPALTGSFSAFPWRSTTGGRARALSTRSGWTTLVNGATGDWPRPGRSACALVAVCALFPGTLRSWRTPSITCTGACGRPGPRRPSSALAASRHFVARPLRPGRTPTVSSTRLCWRRPCRTAASGTDTRGAAPPARGCAI